MGSLKCTLEIKLEIKLRIKMRIGIFNAKEMHARVNYVQNLWPKYNERWFEKPEGWVGQIDHCAGVDVQLNVDNILVEGEQCCSSMLTLEEKFYQCSSPPTQFNAMQWCPPYVRFHQEFWPPDIFHMGKLGHWALALHSCNITDRKSLIIENIKEFWSFGAVSILLCTQLKSLPTHFNHLAF